MLTTNPVPEFHLESHAGKLCVGFDGDLTVLSEDPMGTTFGGSLTCFTLFTREKLS